MAEENGVSGENHREYFYANVKSVHQYENVDHLPMRTNQF